jgi:hypothetical protein
MKMREIKAYPGRAFSATADPDLFFMGDAARTAYETIEHAIRARRGSSRSPGRPESARPCC